MDRLEAAGYAQYEISNYARPGRECRHNLAYWLGRDYLGLGPSAFSTVGVRRWQNVPDTATYTARIGAGEFAASFVEELSQETRRAETFAFSLRTDRGLSTPRQACKTTVSRWSVSQARLPPRTGDRLLLTRRGKLVADLSPPNLSEAPWATSAAPPSSS